MKLYVTRHGETAANAAHLVSGVGDVPLTPRGEAQAMQLAERACKEPIQVILSSPLQRARCTAQPLADRLGLPVLLEPRLAERDLGIFEGREIEDPAFLPLKRSFTARLEGGESILDVAARIYPLLEELKGRYPGKNILLVCHGTVCRVIHSYFYDLTQEAFWEGIPDNCALRVYDW